MTAFGILKSARVPVLPSGETPDAKRSKEQYGWLGDVAIKVLSEMGVLLLDPQPAGTVTTSYPAPSDPRTILMVLGASGGATCYLYVNGAWTAMTPALYRAVYGGAGVITGGIGGTANDLTLGSLSTPIQSLVAGVLVSLQPTLNNSGASTLEVGSFGSKPIVRDDGSALSGGELLAGRQYLLIYDGTSWQLTGNAVNFKSQTTAPTNPSVMDEWYDQATGILKKYIYDGTAYIWKAISSASATVFSVIDNLTTTSTTDALSANQGVVLKNLVTAAQSTASSAASAASSAQATANNAATALAVPLQGIGCWIEAIDISGSAGDKSGGSIQDTNGNTIGYGTWRRHSGGNQQCVVQRIA